MKSVRKKCVKEQNLFAVKTARAALGMKRNNIWKK